MPKVKRNTPKPTKEQGDVIRYYKTENGTYYILKLQHDMHAGVTVYLGV